MLSNADLNKYGNFIDVQECENKDGALIEAINKINNDQSAINLYFKKSSKFLTLPNSIIGYSFDDYILDLFKLKTIEKAGLQARQGHALVSMEHFRLFWEIKVIHYFNHLYNGSEYSLFYIPYRDTTLIGNENRKVKYNKSVVLRNPDFQNHFGIGYGKRGDILDAHILKRSFIFTVEGQTISKITKKEAYYAISHLNSIFSQLIINLYSGQHKQAGYINLLPYPELQEKDAEVLKNTIDIILEIKRSWYSIDETCLEFHHLIRHFTKHISLIEGIKQLQEKLSNEKHQYLSLVKKNDDFWLQKAKIPTEALPAFEAYKSKRPNENLISIDGVTDDTIENNPNMAYEIISNILGIAYGRWNFRSVQDPGLIPPFSDFFDALPFMPEVSLNEIPLDYPVDVPIDGILVSDRKHYRNICQSVTKVIYLLWPDNGDKIINELCEIGGLNKLEDFLDSPTGFFDFHYKRYTKSRREAPIYWPISTPSGSYTIWLYYPAINDQTLYCVVNNYLKDKIKDTDTEISLLENNATLDNKGLKLLRELTDFKFELLDFEKEILRVAQLPYIPNHEDGVLINASPLHKLFRHSKWHKSTEECWKALEKGEYDWAHLAYSIWPARVKTKCKKDLSIAITHDLEDICDIKPKEKQTKKVTELKERKNKQSKLDM